MTAATAIDPRDYAIIRALGALSLASPNLELARAFLREADAGARIHHAAQVQRCQQVLAKGVASRIGTQTVAISFHTMTAADAFEALAKEAKEHRP